MRKVILVLLQSILVTSAFGQDLTKLQDRAKRLLALRSAGNKSDAVQYVEASKRNAFLDRNAPPMSDPRLVALEFTDDPKVMTVAFRATFAVAGAGSFPLTVRESWIWNGKDWFLRIEDSGSPFDVGKSAAGTAPVKPMVFELAATKIDLGKHIQGEIVKRTLDFKSDKDSFLAVYPQEFPGLSIKNTPVWTSNDTGQLEVTLDTALLSQNVNYVVDLQAVSWAQQKIHAKFELTAEIDPRLRFSQVPELLNPAKSGGTAEIHIQNLSQTPFKTLSILSTNDAYQITNDVPDVIAPGETLILVVAYPQQPNPVGAALYFKISEPLLAGRSSFVVPLNTALPATGSVGYTKEELEEILRKSKEKD